MNAYEFFSSLLEADLPFPDFPGPFAPQSDTGRLMAQRSTTCGRSAERARLQLGGERLLAMRSSTDCTHPQKWKMASAQTPCQRRTAAERCDRQ